MPEVKRARLDRIDILLLAVSLLVVVVYFRSVSQNSPAFFIDEASIAYNAHLIAQRGVDEHGISFPLYFRAFGEYKNPLYIYLLAAVYKFTGPSASAARHLSALVGIIAAMLLALLAHDVTGKRAIGLTLFVITLLTPWLFEISRLVFEVAVFPALLSGFLLLLFRASRSVRWSWRIALSLGVMLGLLFYSYSTGRLLAPLFAMGLALFLTRAHWRAIVLAWAVFGVMLLPFAVFSARNPGSLGERFKFVTYVKPGDTRAQIAKRFARNYVGNFSPQSWLIKGDPEPRHHLPGMGSLLVGMVMLAAFGLIVIFVKQRQEPWWRFVLFGLVVSPIPASLTLDHFHTLRLIALPVFLLVLTIPAFEFLWRENRRHLKLRRVVLVVLLILTLAQGLVFQRQFLTAPERVDAFDSYYPQVLNNALAQPERPVYLLDKTPAAYMYAYWYATLRGLDLNNFQRATKETSPPAGAVVISHELPCTKCEMIFERGQFRVYRQK